VANDPSVFDEVEAATALLERHADDPTFAAELDRDTRVRLTVAAGRFARPSKKQKKTMNRAVRAKAKKARRDKDIAILDTTGIRSIRQRPVYPTPAPGERLLGCGRTTDDDPASLPAEPSHDEAARDLRSEVRGDEGGEQSRGGPRSDDDPQRPRIDEPRNCYVCKATFQELHHFYDQMCEPCAALNWSKRDQSADLSGRVALITGARVKIGYQAAIKLLRAGARVVVTTRFPRDAAARYEAETDYEDWRDRLSLFGLDLRHTPSVERFTARLCSELDRLDFILNNACQTVRRPSGFYRHLIEAETAAGALPATVADHSLAKTALFEGRSAALLSQVPLLEDDRHFAEALFPAGKLDADLQQVDLRDKNSWRLRLHEVSTVELFEVTLVNAIAPYIINGRLKPLMMKTSERDKHVVNVSAMEGQFYRYFKTDKHPHTNMAKAALNMMTRTSATDYVKDGIHMNSVDTGWVTDEDPAAIAERKAAGGFTPPLDIVDGAARIVDPIFSGFNDGEHVWGQFLKDYRPVCW